MKQASKVPLWRKLVTYFTVACLLMHNLVEAMEADEDHDSCNWVTGKNPYGISNPISWAVCGNESEGENREEERLDEEEFEEVDYESNNIEDVLLEYNTVLSNEMITRILNFLDKETLKSMRLVSKRYHDLVDDFVYKPALNYKPLEPATEDYKKLVQNYYLTLPINSYLIIETFKGNVPLYKQKDGKIDLKAIWPNETLPCSSNELFSKITKFLKIKASKIRRMLPCTFYRSTDKRQTVNLTKEELATNVLYERTCQGDLEAYEALKGKAAEDPLATGLLLRYLALNGKYLLNSLAVYNTAQGYLNKYKDKLLDLASQGHPYALDISATMLSLPETAMTHASQAVEQNLSRANEHLATLASNKANFHLLRAFKNGSLYAALKLAANVSIDDEPLSLEILKYAAIQGDRDALAEIGRYYERNNQPTIAFLYYRILVLEDHVLGFYKLGMQWFKEWTGRRNDYRLSLLAEKALYISLDHYQKLSSLSLSKWTHKKDLQDNLHKGYKRLICLWMRQVSSKHYYRPPVLNSEIKLERLRVKLESFVWHPNKRKQEGVELLLKVAKKITRYKLDKSSTNKLEYSQILSSIWLCLWRLLKEELCNIRLLPASDEFSLPYPKSVVEALEASLEPHYKYLKREEIIFNKDLNAFQRTHFLNHYLFISLISSRMDKNAIERSYPNYLTSFYNLAKIFHKRKKRFYGN
ncbi:F-box protein [Candidatus Odyssella thessalonicensis]|uniref:F-box protein n=1 Tax=Candidatus Odyssella thessalonicensis TaxID=84647 RepID=UPI000225AC98|nr:F-box protein [Candidatus Odyssella thessalonicensis]